MVGLQTWVTSHPPSKRGGRRAEDVPLVEGEEVEAIVDWESAVD